MTLSQFWITVDEICAAYNCSVTGGRRTAHRNRIVGGAAKSRHLSGTAADIVPDDWKMKAEIITAFTNKGITVIDEQRLKNHLHVHVDVS